MLPMFAHTLFCRDGDCHRPSCPIAGENTGVPGMFTPERASVAIVLGGVNGERQNLAVAPRASKSEAKTD